MPSIYKLMPVFHCFIYQARPSSSDATNRLILRLIDAAIEDARERGAGEEELSDMMRKRGGIGKCFFHALN